MVKHSLVLALRLTLPAIVVSLAIARETSDLVYEYPQGTWIENAAVRRSGSILLTSLNNPGGLSSLNPFDASTPVVLTNDFGYLNSTLGIVETEPDNFFVIASNFSLDLSTLGVQQGTNSIYHVKFETEDGCDPATPTVTLLAELPDASFLNGLTKFNNTLLLAADSGLGAVWAVDTMTGEAEIVLGDPLMAPQPSVEGGFAEGINGIHYRDDILYFTNSDRMMFCRMRLDDRAQSTGPATIIATPVKEGTLLPKWDDFALDKTGAFAYIATGAGHTIQRVDLRSDDVVIVAGDLNSTAIAEPVAVVFGRTFEDDGTIYALTAGGLGAPVVTAYGVEVLGAQVVAVRDLHRSRRF